MLIRNIIDLIVKVLKNHRKVSKQNAAEHLAVMFGDALNGKPKLTN